MDCYTINGVVVDVNRFLIHSGIENNDFLCKEIYDMEPGASKTITLEIVRLPYDGNFKHDLRRQVELAHKDNLSDEDILELRTITDKLNKYLYPIL